MGHPAQGLDRVPRWGHAMSNRQKPEDLRPTWVEIRLSALETNLSTLAERLQPATRLMAVVKANAYGHGLRALAPVWQRHDQVQWLGVAVLSEALALRQEGVTKPILVLGHTPDHSWHTAARHNIALTFHAPAQHQALSAFAASAHEALRIHVKVDTGMNRLGLAAAAVPVLLSDLARLSRTVQVEGLFTHFHSAHAPDLAPAWRQWEEFHHLVQTLERTGLRPPLCHCANSAATLRLPTTHLDMVRTGGVMFGLHPDFHSFAYPSSITPVLTWHTRIAQLRTLAPGMGVGYDHAFRASQPARIAVVPVGYADGLLRCDSVRRHALLHGQKVPFVGNVCMDQAFLDVTEVEAASVQEGDKITLLGTDDSLDLWSDDVAREEGTIAYDVATRIADRVPRVPVP